ncbi:hypothetical protein IQ266_21015 [filamentous cyanobacterium LEGE 11480]|uniref:Uncharacterized protein n=1 Tax=Romeriopsis navalis LEGE 11480 TaxID=2777977 RepID=A0A928Z6H0_9CYAN|nr:hypothetical protein [Romeriopsis navalis]MBE9032225.1 hypothetical protein [Romeriopsis navalis LEGE 11480]
MAQATDQARHSHVDAISTFLNRYLKPQGKIAKVAQRDHRLQILLEAIDTPEHDHIVPWVTQAIETLKPEGMETLQLFARRAGDKNCAWMEGFVLRSGKLMPMDTMSVAHGQCDESNLIARATEGDIEAITIVVDRALDNPSLRAHIALNKAVLKVTIETIQFLDGQNFAVELANKLKPIGSPKVQTVEIYKQKTATSAPFLLNQIALFESKSRLSTPSY